MERYKRLFQSENNLYVEDSPVVVSAGAITKDTETGKVKGHNRYVLGL